MTLGSVQGDKRGRRQPNLLNKYHKDIGSVCEKIQTGDPDVIVALSRSGPRLLEVFEKYDVFSPSVPVLTDNALDFTPKSKLEQENVVLFDDIAITGQTMWEKFMKLDGRFDIKNIVPTTLAADKDNLMQYEEDHREDFFKFVNDIISPQLMLNESRRYKFLKEVSQSFAYLNKPYDLDHSIFYSDSAQSVGEYATLENVFELTTVHQAEHNFRRYSLIPPNNSPIQNLLNNLLSPVDTAASITKLRIYIDEDARHTSYVPITSFPMYRDQVEPGEVFSDDVPVFEEILTTVANSQWYLYTEDAIERSWRQYSDVDRYKHLFGSDVEKSLYRLIWYLASYAHGIAFQELYGNSIPSLCPDSCFLKEKDLEYLFGQDLSDLLLSTLNTREDEIRQFVANSIEGQIVEGQIQLSDLTTGETTEVIRAEPQFDEYQRDEYKSILEYVSTHIQTDSNYSDQLSTVFEGIELEYELSEDNPPVQNTYPAKREFRETGLTYHQLRNLLKDAGVDFDEEAQIGFSLAVDFLIDAGVQIPMFYEREDCNRFERAYRHGEGALNRKGFNVTINEVVKDLFERVDDESISQIAFEKIGALLTDRLHNGRYWDNPITSTYEFLNGSIRHANGTIDVGPEYHRHGRVVMLEDDHEKNYFTEWCHTKGIIQKNGDGVEYCGDWEEMNDQIGLIKSQIPEGDLYTLLNLAMVLYEINEEVDNRPPDYLVAISTCRDKESYARALQAELQLFFGNPEWRIEPSISIARDVREEFESVSLSEFVDRQYEGLRDKFETAIRKSTASREAIYGVQNKRILKEKLDDSEIITDIEEHFEESGNSDNLNTYRQNLKPYLNNLKNIEGPSSPEAFEFVEKSETFGELCIAFSDIYRRTLEICKEIARGETDLRVQLMGSADTSGLYNLVDEYNRLIEDNGDTYYGGSFVRDVPSIDFDHVRIECIQSERFVGDQFEDQSALIIFVQDVLSQVIDAYDGLENIYVSYFRPRNWRGRRQEIFNEPEEEEAKWVIWYDIKDSSDPTNAKEAERLKRRLNEEMTGISQFTHDGIFDPTNDDENHIFVKNDDNVDRFINMILDQSSLVDMYVRIGACKVPSEKVEYDKYDEPKSTPGHVRSVRIGSYLDKIDEEKSDVHTLSVSHSVTERLWETECPPSSIQQDWDVDESLEFEVDMKDPDVFIRAVSYRLSKDPRS